MALDEAIAMDVIDGSVPPTLRFYGWMVPSVSLGYFQRIDDIDLGYCLDNNLPVVRRPTGGRAILHNEELTYSFSARNDHGFSSGLKETYSIIARAFSEAMRRIGLEVEIMQNRKRADILGRSPLCFNSTSLGEITFKGTKIIGSAQRRWRKGFIQQGTIPYNVHIEKMKGAFKIPSEETINLKGLSSFIKIDKGDVKKAITEAFEATFDIRLVWSHPSEGEVLLAERLLREKYLRPEWNLARQEVAPSLM